MAAPLKIVSIKTLPDRTQISKNLIRNTTWKCRDGRIYTELNPTYLSKLAPLGYNPYDKAFASNRMENWSPNIIRPIAIVQEKGNNKGFITLPMGDEKNVTPAQYYFKKSSFFQWMTREPGKESYDFANDTLIHCTIEEIISKELELAFPDGSTDGNIVISSQGVPYILDFCGIQVGEHMADAISEPICGLVEDKKINGKYIRNNSGPLFTKEIDKAGLISLYFSAVFRIQFIERIRKIETQANRERAIRYMLESIGFEDEADLFDAIRKIFEQSDNVWLGEQIKYIAEKYQIVYQPDMSIIQVGNQGFQFSCLRKAIRR